MLLKDFHALLRNKKICFYSDSHELVCRLQQLGYPSQLTSEFDFAYSNHYAFVIPSSFDMLRKSSELWRVKFDGCIILLFAAIKFNDVSNLDATWYTLEAFLKLNIEDVIELRQSIYQMFSDVDSLKLVNADSSRLNLYLEKKLETSNFDEILKTNWQYSTTEICEASIINIKHDKSSISCDGIFHFDGIISTCSNLNPRQNNKDNLKTLNSHIHAAKEKYLIIEDNAIKHLIFDGEDHVKLLHNMKYSELERGLAITEVAVGCNKNLQPNWHFNSVANESVYGTHLGIGMATKCPHIDFIKANVLPTPV